MKYPSRVQKAIDEMIMSGYFLTEQQQYILKEPDEQGYSELTVSVNGRNLCIENYDKKLKCEFVIKEAKYGMTMCVDHVLFVMDSEEHWKVYLIEMKSGMGKRTFLDVKRKVRANYFSIKALCAYLGIELSDKDIEVYVTYSSNSSNVTPNETPNPATLKAMTGQRYTGDVMQLEWNKNRIELKKPEKHEFVLHKVEMQKVPSPNSPSGQALVNSISITA